MLPQPPPPKRRGKRKKRKKKMKLIPPPSRPPPKLPKISVVNKSQNEEKAYIYIYIYIYYIYIYTNPCKRVEYDTASVFKRCETDLNSKFSFSLSGCRTKIKKLILPYNLPISGGRIVEFIPSKMVLGLCEMQAAKLSIWTRVSVSISHDDKLYTTSFIYIYFGLVWFGLWHVRHCRLFDTKSFLFIYIGNIWFS